MNDKLLNFCKQIPKVELHAHLNGSLSASTLELLGCQSEDILKYQKLTQEINKTNKNLEECFSLFKIAHDATNDPNALYLATKNVIQEFQNDNVIYLELRTTPRANENMTTLEYVEAVIKGIHDSSEQITTKLLLSLDRRHDLKKSQENMALFIKMGVKYPDIVKGVDLSGDPSCGIFDKKLFQQAVDNGLLVTIHCAEIRNDEEVKEILSFHPHRIGHGTFLHPKYRGSEECWNIYNQKTIPLECCLTSNVLCETVNSYEEHHIKEWIQNSLPFTICTDDKGVFGTSLSQELYLASQHFNLKPIDLWKIMFNSVAYSFASNNEKFTLRNVLMEWKEKNLS